VTNERVKEVAALLANPSTLIFAGAGVSVWSGLPTWPALLSKLIERADALAPSPLAAAHAHFRSGNYLDVGDIVEDALGPDELLRTIRSDLGFESAVPSKAHELITSFPSKCFVTTNFDSLIENQITIETGLRPKVVTNLDPIDMPSVTRADADRFVFKPHGDLDRASSIVLSRKRYLSGLAGPGAQSPAAQCLRLLMASRPVVFFGYSLSDLDFQLIHQSLRDIFSGSGPPIWAIMPNLPEHSHEHLWAYGIRALHYDLKKEATGGAAHAPFLDLLELVHSELPASCRSLVGPTMLDFARYGARLAQQKPAPGWDLRVGIRKNAAAREWMYSEHTSLLKILSERNESYLMLGSAGSGKSFSIREYIATAGRQLVDWALSPQPVDGPIALPILLDARLYAGSFANLYEAAVPPELAPNALGKDVVVTLIIDSLDEMPSAYLESGDWLPDLDSLIAQLRSPRLVIASRREELAARPELARANIFPLDRDVVHSEMASVGVALAGRDRELAQALHTPFILKCAIEIIPKEPMIKSVRELLQSFVGARLAKIPNEDSRDQLLAAVMRAAYSASSQGVDTIASHSILEEILYQGILEVDARRYVNQMVEVGLLDSEIGDNVRFIHRSVLEFLASLELLRKISVRQADVHQLLESRRWDNVIAWCAGAIGSADARSLFDAVADQDLGLAARIAKNAEVGRAELLSLVLERSKGPGTSYAVEAEIKETVFPPECKTSLLELATRPDTLGQSAAQALIPLLSKREVLKAVAELASPSPQLFPTGYTYAKLAETLSTEGLKKLLKKAGEAIDADPDLFLNDDFDEISDRIEGAIVGAIQAAPAIVIAWAESGSEAVQKASIGSMWKARNRAGLEYLIRQWDRGFAEASFPLSMIIDDEASWIHLLEPTSSRLKILETHLSRDLERSTYHLLSKLADLSESWRSALEKMVDNQSDSIKKLALQLSIPHLKRAATEHTLDILCAGGKDAKVALPLIGLLDRNEVANQIDRVIYLIEMDNSEVLKNISGLIGFPFVQIDCISWNRYRRITEVVKTLSKSRRNDHEYEADRLSSWVGSGMTDDALSKFLEVLNNRNLDRRFEMELILPHVAPSRISTDDLTPEAAITCVNCFISGRDLMFSSWSPGSIASEKFIKDVVIPLSGIVKSRPQRARLNAILVDAGDRHGVRYELLDQGELPKSRQHDGVYVA
jgi:SIR2-like domain